MMLGVQNRTVIAIIGGGVLIAVASVWATIVLVGALTK